MKFATITLIAWFGLSATCFARLGETFEECQTRYGLLVKVDSKLRPVFPQYCFEKDGIEIRIRFFNSHSVQETFSGITQNLNDLTVAELLNANAQGLTWSATKVGRAKAYTRQDKKATAQYVRSQDKSTRDTLTVETAEFSQIFKGPAAGF